MKKRILGKSRVNNIHRFVSIKSASTICTESTLEYDACFHLEYNNNILKFESQPLGYEYHFDGKHRKYTPDFLIYGHDDHSNSRKLDSDWHIFS